MAKSTMSLEPVFAVAILMSYVLMGHLLEEWKSRSQRALLTFHESVPAVLMGCIVGLALRSSNADLDGGAFFEFVLPFIILHQGYALKKKNFFRYLWYIVLFGVMGTLITFVSISGVAFLASRLPVPLALVREGGQALRLTPSECMKLAAVLSAADEVATMGLIPEHRHPKLSAILFGEGVVNDAVSILLFRAVAGGVASNEDQLDAAVGPALEDDKATHAARVAADWSADLFSAIFINFLGLLGAAVGIGCGIGLCVSLLLKCNPGLRNEPVRQTAIVLLGGYLSFSLSEAFGASGILAVFFCGITMNHYGWHSLGEEARTSTQVTFGTLSAVSEAYCFAAMGLSLHNFSGLLEGLPMVIVLFAALMGARFLTVYSLLSLQSWCKRPWGGLDQQREGDAEEATPLVSSSSSSSNGTHVLAPMNAHLRAEGNVTPAEQKVLWSSGLVRGAVAFAQVLMVTDDHADLLKSITMTIVLFTTIVFGVIMPFIVRDVNAEDDPTRTPVTSPRTRSRKNIDAETLKSGTSPPNGHDHELIEPIYDHDANVIGHGRIYQWWARFDDRFMKKFFGGRGRRHGEASPDGGGYGATEMGRARRESFFGRGTTIIRDSSSDEDGREERAHSADDVHFFVGITSGGIYDEEKQLGEK